jgi:hypothetical protein
MLNYLGHTATFYKGDKLLVFGGENEHRAYLQDLIILDVKTATWTLPAVHGPVPRGRARHAAFIHDDKLFISGGVNGHSNHVLDDICYLDLKTFTWSKAYRFVDRFDHKVCVWNDRLYAFGGMNTHAEKVNELYWLDLKGAPVFNSVSAYDHWNSDMQHDAVSGHQFPNVVPSGHHGGTSGYVANTSSTHVNPATANVRPLPIAPGTVASVKFVHGAEIPRQAKGNHFHVFSSGSLLDFVTPALTKNTLAGCSLSALELENTRWQTLARGPEIYAKGYEWHYSVANEDGTKAWLIGCQVNPEPGVQSEEHHLSDIMEIDLRRYGLLGNILAKNQQPKPSTPTDRRSPQPSKGLGKDLAKLFDIPPEQGSGADFIITSLDDHEFGDEDTLMSGRNSRAESPNHRNWLDGSAATSRPIHVHRIILQARWPHFDRLWNSQMQEFHTKKMHVEEPYSVVRCFLHYLYTDSVHPEDVPDLDNVAGLLVLSHIYDIPDLRLLCVNRLLKEMDIEHACTIWHCAGTADEVWLRKRAASYCLKHWGRVVRTKGFLNLPRPSLIALNQEIDVEGRAVPSEELDPEPRYYNGWTGSRYRKDSATSMEMFNGAPIVDLMDSDDDADSEGMEM